MTDGVNTPGIFFNIANIDYKLFPILYSDINTFSQIIQAAFLMSTDYSDHRNCLVQPLWHLLLSRKYSNSVNLLKR